MRGWQYEYGGVDNQGYVHKHIYPVEANDRNDQIALGRVTLHFDERTFNVPGHWQQFFVRFIGRDGQTVSTVDMDFDVIDDQFFAHVGNAGRDYIGEFERILEQVTDKGNAIKDKLNEAGETYSQEFSEWLAKYKQSLNDAMAEVNDPKNGLYVRYNQLLEMTQQIQETLKQAQFHDRAWQFSDVPTMQSYAALAANDLAITKGWDNYDDGHGAVWQIRVKHKDETPDGTNVIALSNGMVAERNASMVTADSLEDLLYGYEITIVHNQADYPEPKVMYYEYAIGTEPNGLGSGPSGFGQTNTKLVPCMATYPDANTIKVRLPRNFYLSDAPNFESSAGAWYVHDGYKTIKVSLGNVNAQLALTGEGKGKSTLAGGSGYFSKPTSPTDLRAIYIDEHTQRLEWRN
nr:DUF2479 domain-containing protein [Limosilactobacillus mucosae]